MVNPALVAETTSIERPVLVVIIFPSVPLKDHDPELPQISPPLTAVYPPFEKVNCKPEYKLLATPSTLTFESFQGAEISAASVTWLGVNSSSQLVATNNNAINRKKYGLNFIMT